MDLNTKLTSICKGKSSCLHKNTNMDLMGSLQRYMLSFPEMATLYVFMLCNFWRVTCVKRTILFSAVFPVINPQLRSSKAGGGEDRSR